MKNYEFEHKSMGNFDDMPLSAPSSCPLQKKTIEAGKVTINGEVVKPDFVLGQNHLIQHTCHR